MAQAVQALGQAQRQRLAVQDQPRLLVRVQGQQALEGALGLDSVLALALD